METMIRHHNASCAQLLQAFDVSDKDGMCQAIKGLSGALHNLKSSGSSSLRTQLLPCSCSSDSTTTIDDCIRQSPVCCPTERACTNSGNCFIYKSAIVIPVDMNLQDSQLANTASSIVIFNLALAHHLLAMSHDRDEAGALVRSSLLQKAAALYKMVYDMLAMSGLVGSLFSSLAIANNLGSVYMELQEDAKAEALFDYLLSGLMVGLHARQEDHLNLNDSLRDDYFRNIFQGAERHCPSPAA